MKKHIYTPAASNPHECLICRRVKEDVAHSDDLDPKTLTREQINAAIVYHCRRMGSYEYYVRDEIIFAERYPHLLVVFQHEGDQPRAYVRREEIRRKA